MSRSEVEEQQVKWILTSVIGIVWEEVCKTYQSEQQVDVSLAFDQSPSLQTSGVGELYCVRHDVLAGEMHVKEIR